MPSIATVLPFLLVWSLFLSLGGTQEDGRTATFYGGHYHMGLQPAPSELTVDLSFMSSHQTGLLFVARLHMGYFALGMRERQLHAVLNYNEQIHQFLIGTVDSSDWQDVGVHLQNTLLNATFNSDVLTFVLDISSAISFMDISFGGPDFSFDLDLNNTEHFIGCLTNVSVNNREVVFTPDQGRYGIETGCCPDVRPASWCFSASSYLNLNASTTSSDQLVVSFHIHSHRDGVVLFSRTETDTIVLELHLGSLHLVVNSGCLDCPGQITNGNWHSVRVTVRSAALQCEVDGRENVTVVSSLSPSLATPFYIGNPTTRPLNSVTAFHSQPLQGVSDTFGGCIQEFQVNSIDVVPITIDTNGPQISGACNEVSPSPTSPTPSESPTALECAVLGQSGLINWDQLQIMTESIMVTEGGVALITLNSLRVQFSFIGLPQRISDSIETSIRFHVISEPTDGHFQRAGSDAQISSFSYEDLDARLIMYRHSGAEDRLDYVILKVTVECDSEVLLERTLLPLYFNVSLENDSPEILQQSAMNVAIGTRQVISQDVITVADAETSRAFLTYSVHSVDTCGHCSGGEQAGQIEITDTPGQAHIFFTQDEIDRGEIAFQHFARFGNATVKIYLLVTDHNSGQISVEITVNPYEGHINLTASRCLYVVEGAPAVIQPRHLSATTDFQDQSPTLTYDILSPPSHGTLERLERYDPLNESMWQWEPIDEVVRNRDSFTQAYINASRVRYVHNNSILPVEERDSFEAHLRSTNLAGPELSVCVHVIHNETFRQSNINIEVGEIHVPEGGEAEIILNATFSPSIFADWMEQEIEIGQLAITYVISPKPLYGEIQVRGEPLGNGTFTHTDLQGGLVVYRHNGTEDHSDSFGLYAELQSTLTLPTWVLERTPAMNISVVVQPVNNHKPQIVQREPVSPPEGGWVTLTPAMLEVLDEDQPGDNITIHIRRKTDTPNGYFAFGNSRDTLIRQLTMEDIRQGRVIFVHLLNSSAPLSYRQAIKAEDQNPSHTEKNSILVEAIPLNLTATPVNLPNTSCIGEIDATLSSRSLPLDYSTISLSLEDHHGNDFNRLQDVRIVVVTPPRYGMVQRRGEGVALHSFTAAELSAQTLEYYFRDRRQSTEADSFELEFRYGHTSSGPIPFQICINPVPVPSVVYSRRISAARGGVADLNASVLLATDTRGGLNRSLLYTVTVQPRHGILCDELVGCPEALTSFSQHAINIDSIIYNHTNMSTTELRDSFSFVVCTSYSNCTRPHSVNISLFVSDLIIVNTGIRVSEGGNHSIRISELNAIAPPGYDVIFVINKQPQRGNLSFQIRSRSSISIPLTHFDSDDLRSGYVVYYHDNSETLIDCFEFTATAVAQNKDSVAPNGTIHDHTGMVHVTILPVNNKIPLLYNFTNPIVLVQGGSLAITRDLMSAHDSDSDAVDDLLTYTVFFTGPVYGFLYFGDDPNRRTILSWTEGDIRSGRLFYQHTSPSLTNDLVAFTLSDGKHEKGYIFQIELRTVLFEKNTTYSHLTVVEGGSDVITQDYLRYFSTNDPLLNDEDYVYKIRKWPSHGQLLFNGSNATQFSQEDLLRDTLVYSHDHSNAVTDSFKFIITVPVRQNAKSDLSTFKIVIIPVDDEAPVVQYIREPMFVVELTRLAISSRDIQIYDYDSDRAHERVEVRCTIVEPPRYGYILKSNYNLRYFNTSEFTLHDLYLGYVAYSHQERGQWSDHFIFNVTDGVPNPQPETSQVNITILPQVVNVTVTNITVREGGEVALAPDNFRVEHPYLRHVPGEIHVISQPEHGLLLNTHTNGSSVSSFTTEDLARGSILYRHSGEESEQDKFVFEYENREPSGFQRRSSRKELTISISLVNDQPPILDSGRERIMRLWVGQSVVLNRTYLNATDGDTPPQNLTYNFSISIDVGHLAHSGAPHRELHFFTQNDVDEGQVLLVHNTSLEGRMAYRVSDEISFTEGYFDIIAEQLVLRRQVNQPANVSMGGSVVISPAHLLYGTSDSEQREIRYTVLTPMYGKIVVNSIESNQFTQLDINAGGVQYVHTDFDRWESKDTLVITASTDLAEDDMFQFTVFIAHPKSPYSDLAVNEPVVIQEGQSVCFNESVLDARNLRYSSWQMHRGNLYAYAIIFQPTALPLHGSYIINGVNKTVLHTSDFFTQANLTAGIVCYEHDNTETVFDTLPFKLTIKDNGILRSTYYSSINITIEPVNDQEPVLETTSLSMTAVIGYNATISQGLLRVTDGDTLAKDIWYTVFTQPQNGNLYNDSVVIAVGQNFTQDDIDAGLLKFEPLYSGEGVFNFTFSDRLSARGRPVHSFTVHVENHTVVLERKETITYQQDRPDQVVSSYFLNTSTNGFRNETKFVIQQAPSNGSLGLAPGEFFTQAQVDENVTHYVPTNPISHRDKFVVDITNRNFVIPNITIEIRVLALGHVKEDVHLDLSSGTEPSLPLPADLLQLDSLQRAIHRPPTIRVIRAPTYGHLEMRITSIQKRSAHNEEAFSFRYDELQFGWIYYVLDPNYPDTTTPLEESFDVVVFSDGRWQPGELTVELTIQPPPFSPTTSSSSPSVTSAAPTSPPLQGSDSSSGFPMYALVLILGTFIILIIIIVVVIVFCLTQQKNIRKRWKVKASAPTQHPYPWSVHPPSGLPRPSIPGGRYNSDPVGDNSENGEDVRSGLGSPLGYSESPLSRHSPIHSQSRSSPPRYSPVHSQARSSPPYGHPRPRGHRVQSIVSISLSNRLSSNASLTESSYRPTPSPYPVVTPIPIRPLSSAPSRRNSRDEGDSLPAAKETLEPTAARPASSEGCESGMGSRSVSDCTSSRQSPVAGTSPSADSGLNFGGPEMMQLFRSSNPILKKQEYWV